MKLKIMLGIIIVVISTVFALPLLTQSYAWANSLNGAVVGRKIGSIIGLLVGTYVMWRVHPILGILTLIGGLSAILSEYPFQ